MSANEKIKAVMKENETWLLRRIRKVNREGHGLQVVCFSIPLLHALHRLVEAKKIKYSKKVYGYVIA